MTKITSKINKNASLSKKLQEFEILENIHEPLAAESGNALQSVLEKSNSLKKLNARLTETLSKLHHAETELSSAIEEKQALLNELNQLSGQISALRDMYEDSSSWRITAPLRRLASMPVFRKIIRLKNRTIVEFAAQTFYAPNPASGHILQALAEGRQTVLFADWHIKNHNKSEIKKSKELPNITISVVTYNSEKWIDLFINSLIKQKYHLKKINIHFTDNNSNDSTLKKIELVKIELGNKFLSFKLSKLQNNGYGSGNDNAIKASIDDFVLVTNVDIEFNELSIMNVVTAALDDSPDVACWELRQAPFEHPKYYDPVTLEAVWSSHACVLFRRSAYIAVGGYETRLFMYGEDVELSYRWRRAGYILRYVPAATITHHVDLQDSTIRPLQLSGSLSANALLRIRFGSRIEARLGMLALRVLARKERDPIRSSAFENAIKQVKKHRRAFALSRPAKTNTLFPFAGFDYVMARDGHDYPQKLLVGNRELPLVSVITRTHGQKNHYLSEALVSVLNQTYQNIEHLIVEDQTDFAAELVEGVKQHYDANIKYIKSDGKGRSRAGNCGLKAANGKYVMFLDNDDLLFPDHVEILVSRLVSDPQLKATYSLAWEVVTAENSHTRSPYTELYHQLPASHRRPYDAMRLRVENFIPIQAILFQRDLYERFGGFDEELEQLEDWNLWVRYSRGGAFELISKLTSIYRTPADPEKREARSQLLNSAYQDVYAKNQKIY